jgi:hypothetical protein
VSDLTAAMRAGRLAAMRFELPEPVLVRHGMNVVLRCGDVALRVADPNVPAGLSLELAATLLAAGIPVARPVRDVPFESEGYAVTAWEHLESTGEAIDWTRLGRIVAAVHELPAESLPAGLPLPSPRAFPWWELGPMLDEIGTSIDARARSAMLAVLERHDGWDDFDGRADNVVCHGDVHPGNVLVTESGVTLIDWDLLCRAPRGWDHAPLMTWTERWGGATGVYEAFADGYGWSARGDRYAEAFAELRLVAATLMRCRLALHQPEARIEAERRLSYWRGEPGAAAWIAQ